MDTATLSHRLKHSCEEPALRLCHYRAGELVTGWDVAVAVNKLSRGAKENEIGGDTGAVIVGAGQLRRGTPVDMSTI